MQRSLKHENLLLCPVLYHCKFKIFEFWAAGQKKTSNLKVSAWVLRNHDGHFSYFKRLITKSSKIPIISILIESMMEVIIGCSFVANSNELINDMRDAVGRQVYSSLSTVTALTHVTSE